MIVGSFYVRRWIGVKAWRWLHRWTLAVYVLGIAHALGAGTDARARPGCSALLVLTGAPMAVVTTVAHCEDRAMDDYPLSFSVEYPDRDLNRLTRRSASSRSSRS